MVQQLKPRLPALKYVFVVGDDVPQGALSVKEILEKPMEKKYPPDYLEKTKTPATELSMVVHTTGTTGFPKFVEHAIAGRLCTARGHIAGSKLTDKDTTAALGPAAAGPNAVAYLAGPTVGAKMLMLEHFDAESALEIIEKEKVTFPCLVPAMLAMMIRSPKLGQHLTALFTKTLRPRGRHGPPTAGSTWVTLVSGMNTAMSWWSGERKT